VGERQTLPDQLLYFTKVQALRLGRLIVDLGEPARRWPQQSPIARAFERIEIRSPLYVDDRVEEKSYELGKAENLRIALRRLDGVEIPAGEIFSFWRQVGRPTSRRGFVSGRMLQLGCVVPAVGGGLCQISNALYELALRSGCEIVERHPHSVRLPESPLRDATVAWNYIDLRFRPKNRLQLDLKLTGTELVAAFLYENSISGSNSLHVIPPAISEPDQYRGATVGSITCSTCQKVDCSRYESLPVAPEQTQAFLVDAFWPEFDSYLQQMRRNGDLLCAPIDGSRLKWPQYAWSTKGFGQVRTEPLEVFKRSLKLRRLSSQGASRQTELLRASARMASSMAARLPYIVGHLVVDQTMLPALWQSGALGGRTFDVLMRRLPIRLLQARLDEVSARWPQSLTAADFRVGEGMLSAEDEALNAAANIVTPHLEVAALFPNKARLLDWIVPNAAPFFLQTDGATPRILFPGPVTARKGAYVLREALQGLPLEVIWTGSELEGPDFWGDISNRRGIAEGFGIAAVIQPAFLEDRPRALLQAMASGIPVITTEASGIAQRDGVQFVRMGDVGDLRQSLKRLMNIEILSPHNEAQGTTAARQ